MITINHKHVECKRPQHAKNELVLSVSPYYEGGILRLSFYRGDMYFSNLVHKDEAREFAENILELIEEIAEPNPNQEAA